MKTSRPIALGLLASLAVSAHALTFDDFSTSAASVSYDAASGMKSGGAVALGGGISRTLRTEILSNDDPGDARARSSVASGHYSFSTDAEVWGDGRLAYTFSPLDLGAAATFQLDFLSNDMAGVGGVTLTDAIGHSAFLMFVLPAHRTAFSVVTPSFAGKGLDLGHVVEADFMLNPGQGGDLMIGAVHAVQTVPEPASLAAVGLGAFGILRRRRRA